VLCGANGSGKTFVGVREARLFSEGRHPVRPDVVVPNFGWVVSPTYKMSEEIIEPYLGVRSDPHITPIFPLGYGTWRAARRVLDLPNGSAIALMSCDQGSLKFAGPKRRWVMFDEEPPQDVWFEAGARLIPGQPLDRWICMTPLEGMTWVHESFVLKPKAGRQRIVFADLGSNPVVSKDQLDEVQARYAGDPLLVARLFGRFTAVGMRPAFPVDRLSILLERVDDFPLRRGFLAPGGEFIEDGDGELRLWREPEPRMDYVIGADVAEGIEGGAWSVASVWRVPDAEQVAEFRARVEPFPFGRTLAKLGRFYNDAFIVPEANNHGHATLSALVSEQEYRNVYQRTPIDREDAATLTGPWGFFTTHQNRYEMEGLLTERIRSGNWAPRSDTMIREFIAATRDSLGNLTPGRGFWLDTVIAAGLAMIGIRQKRYLGWPEQEPQVDTLVWLRSQIEHQRAEREAMASAEEWRY